MNEIICGDCLVELPKLPAESIDLIVTDPPYGLEFMGKDWDKAVPDKKVWVECLRVLKHGAFMFVMCTPRADCLSRMIVNIEDAGFRVDFTPIFWAYASGFPKAMNISKAVDKRNGRLPDEYYRLAEHLKMQRELKGLSQKEVAKHFLSKTGGLTGCIWNWENAANVPTKEESIILTKLLDLDNRFDELIEREEAEREIIGNKPYTGSQCPPIPNAYNGKRIQLTDSLPATDQAKALNGSYGGFQPKPAVEVIIVAMKPLSEKTFVGQVLVNGKGVTWLDDCRIPFKNNDDIQEASNKNRHEDFDSEPRNNKIYGVDLRARGEQGNYDASKGRFPANLLVSDDALNDGRTRTSGKMHINSNLETPHFHKYNGKREESETYGDSGSFSRYFDLDKWVQFLIVPKASKSERGTSNKHPTVKPLKLMSYLITLGSRPSDVVLDPFLGSGTIALSAQMLNRQFIGIEINPDYCKIAEKRLTQIPVKLNVG